MQINKEYFLKRINKETKNSIEFNDLHQKLLKKTKGICLVCDTPITIYDIKEVHHIKPRKLGGNDKIDNLLLLHKICHDQVTYCKDSSLQATFLKKGIIKKE